MEKRRDGFRRRDGGWLKTIRRWIGRLLGVPPAGSQRPAQWPTREEIERLPPFEGLKFRQIVEVSTPEAARRAERELSAAAVVGFDTESRPTFRPGEVSQGPHIAQFAAADRAYVFMLHEPECRRAAGALIARESLKKVGFGLGDDVIRIRAKLQVEPRGVQDLEALFAEKGFGRGVGVKVAVALMLKRRFMKSHRVRTSNWGRHRLSDAQILYAANDAYAAFLTHEALASS